MPQDKMCYPKTKRSQINATHIQRRVYLTSAQSNNVYVNQSVYLSGLSRGKSN
jgi:hypothetical protein